MNNEYLKTFNELETLKFKFRLSTVPKEKRQFEEKVKIIKLKLLSLIN